MEAPTINSRYACIVDMEARVLAAVISAYLFQPESYLPVFLMRRAEVPRADDPAFMTESYLAYAMADEDSTLIGNALVRMGEPDYVILAGLNEAQKSYLILGGRSKTIEIGDVDDIEQALLPLRMPIRGELRCRPSDLLNGLFVAQRRQKRLVIDEGAQPVPEVVDLRKGIVVVENVTDASPVIAINYSNSVGASTLVVDAMPEHEGRNVQTWIQGWKEKNDHREFEKLEAAVWQRIRGIPFSQFEYATFFTEGIPYSLLLENVVPCSYVHLRLRPDLFVVNNIMFNDGKHFHAAVVFSPAFFPDEECGLLCCLLTNKNEYVRPLIGKNATLANFDFHANHFPYDLLHICSHGGEVDGYEMTEQFTDRDGNVHVVEFEEVIGVTPVPDNPDMVGLHTKAFPRKLDGFAWMSAELKKQNLPGHVYLGMWKCMLQSGGKRRKKDRIAMSCAISCADSIHQGDFNALASHSSPLIFNNTCWSWHEVATFFLACGARGYIGTLWGIDNQAAVIAARTFYERLFSGTVLSVFHKALKAIDTTASKDIYVYWGLHFSRLSPGHSPTEGKIEVQKELMRAIKAWVRKVRSTKSAEVRRNSIRVLRLILRELVSNFSSAEVRKLAGDVKRIVPEVTETGLTRNTEQLEASYGSPLDYPMHYREAKIQHKNGA